MCNYKWSIALKVKWNDNSSGIEEMLMQTATNKPNLNQFIKIWKNQASGFTTKKGDVILNKFMCKSAMVIKIKNINPNNSGLYI